MSDQIEKLRVLFELANCFDKKNHKRNIILILTMAFSITALFFLFSIVHGRIIADDLRTVRKNGNAASFMLDHVTDKQYQSILGLEYVDYVVKCREFGTWCVDDKKIAKCITVGSVGFERMYKPAFERIVGKYPESSNEIMLSTRVLKLLGIEEPVLGMQIPAYIIPLDWMTSDKKEICSSYVLSGYYTDYIDDIERLPEAFFSEDYPNYGNVTAFDDFVLMISDKFWTDSDQIERRVNADVRFDSDQNLIVLNEGIAKTLKEMVGSCVFAFFGIIIIILSMNLFVYNIFSISFNEEKQEYGLLKVIGTEPKQIKGIFAISEIKILFWGFLAGIILGYSFVVVLLTKLVGKMYLDGNGSISAERLLSANLLVVSVVLCGLGEIVAFIKCTNTVMKLTPIECSKYEEHISAPIISGRFAKKLGLLGIAFRNFSRNSAKMAITVGSLFAGIEVFLLAIVISNGLDQTNKINQEPDFVVGVTKDVVHYYLSINEGNSLEELVGHTLIPDVLVQEILKASGIDSVNMDKCFGGYGAFSYKSKSIKPRMDSWKDDAEISTGLTIQVVSEEWTDKLEAFIEKAGYNTDIQRFKEGKGFILLHDNELSEVQTKEADSLIGESLSGIMLQDDGCAFELSCCGYLDISENAFPKLNMPWGGSNINYIIISGATARDIGMRPYIYNVSFDVDKKDEKKVKGILQELLRDANQNAELSNSYYMIAKSDLLAKEQSYISAVRIIMGLFSGILMLFAMVSYYNTLITGYNSRKKEFCIMRKIGMTEKQLQTMLIYEGLLYGVAAISLVMTVGSVILIAVGYVSKSRVDYFAFKYPFLYMIVVFVFVIAVSICTPLLMYYNGKRKNYRQIVLINE